MRSFVSRFAPIFVLVLACVLGACQSEEKAAQESSSQTASQDSVATDRSAAALPTTTDLAAALPSGTQHNVLIISFDALRADALGIYGYPRDTSPNIDRFAQQALVFDRAYSAAPVTPTSFAAAFTSQLPMQTFRAWQFHPLDNAKGAPRTLGGAFNVAGYHSTALLNNSQVTIERGFDHGFTDFQSFNAVADEMIVDKAVQWLVANGDQPFFLWVHMLSPHSPYDYRAQSADFYDASYQGKFKTSTTSQFETDLEGDIERIRDLYDGEVFYADQLFGHLMEFVEAHGLLDDTIVVVTSDHGEEFKERGGFQHQYLHEETLRVPMLIRHPEVTQGSRTDALFSNVDLWPTLAAVVGAPGPLDGVGWNLLQPNDAERAIVSVAMTDQRYRGLTLRKGEERLILTCVPELQVHFYDLAEDPGEVNDLAESEPGRVRDLLQLMRLATGSEDPCRAVEEALEGGTPTAGLAPETVESLRALGYIQ